MSVPVALGLDVGMARTGVARVDADGFLAYPLTTVEASTIAELVTQLSRLARNEEARVLVVGMPRNQHGKDGPQAGFVRQVMAGLRDALPDCGLVEIDERYSTQEAQRHLRTASKRKRRQKGVTDQVSAVLILETWLARQSGC